MSPGSKAVNFCVSSDVCRPLASVFSMRPATMRRDLDEVALRSG